MRAIYRLYPRTEQSQKYRSQHTRSTQDIDDVDDRLSTGNSGV